MSLSPSARRSLVPLTTALLVALLAGRAGGAKLTASAAPEPPKGTPEQRQTIQTIRDVGTGIYRWYTDQMKSRNLKRPEHGEAPTSVDVTQVPVISVEELTALLVPAYIARVPATDGWGNPMEYRLNTRDLVAQQIIAIRSPGADGRFTGGKYSIGRFDPDDLPQDLVWTDGYFSRWPQRADSQN